MIVHERGTAVFHVVLVTRINEHGVPTERGRGGEGRRGWIFGLRNRPRRIFARGYDFSFIALA